MKNLFFLLLLFSLSCCSSTKKAPMEQAPTNESAEPTDNKPTFSNEQMRLNDIWAVESVTFDGKTITGKDFQRRPMLELHLSDLRIHGNDGCNSLMGNFSLPEAGKITFDRLGGTKKYCPQTMAQTNAYLSALKAAASYKIAKLKLFFFNEKGEELLRFQKVD